MKKIFGFVFAAVLGLSLTATAKTGDSESSAASISVGKTKDVTLVDDGYGSGVYFLKVTLTKRNAYTCWFEGGDAAEIGIMGFDIDAYYDWGSDFWDDSFDDWSFDDDMDFDDGGIVTASAFFEDFAEQDGKCAAWMYADSWESDDPSSWTYYIQLSGEIGQKTTVHIVKGIRNFMSGVRLAPLPSADSSETARNNGSATDLVGFDADHFDLVFKLQARANVTYKFATSLESGSTALPLTAEIFTLQGLRETPVELANADIAPGKEVAFTAGANTTYYLRLTTEDGKALEYPKFKVHSLAYSADGKLGLLVVTIKGPKEARWLLDAEETEYESGDTIALSGTHTVKFTTVGDLKKPGDSVAAVAPGKDPTPVLGIYSDKADHGDDVAKGAVSWSLKNTETSYERTLWEDDEADHFTFDGKDGYYYDFELSDVTGDAVFSITNATPYDGNAGIFALGETKVSKLALPKLKTKYILVVHHAEDTAVGGTYTISGFYANVGAIKFKSTAVKVKEDAASVKLTLSRTASDGRVRVKYATVADTAQPGKDYVAQSGIVEWVNGDKKDKDIVVKLIPDLVATYEGGDKRFSVKIEPIPEDERGEDEYEAAFTVDKTGVTLDTATVTLTETTKASAGTVSVDCAAPKKPVFDVRAGTDLALTLTRTDAADFPIELKLDASSIGAGVTSVSWEKDDFEPKSAMFSVPAAADMKDTKKGTIKLSVLSKDKPKLTASSITVNVLNDQFEKTVATWAKTLAKTDGVQVKEGSSGTWFYMGDDGEGRPMLKHIGKASKLTLTLTGPCKLRYWVNNAEQEPFDMMEGFIGKTKAFDVYSAAADEDVTVKYEYLYNDGDFETILQTVKYGFEDAIASGSLTGLKVSAGKLPDGVKLEQDKTTKDWYVRGVPTKSGYYYYAVQDRDKNPVVGPKAVYVKAAGTAVGTFNGVVSETDGAVENLFASLGSVQLTVTTAGKLTAKVTIAGTSYSFSGTGFDTVDDVAAEKRTLTAALTLSKKIGTDTYVNELNLTLVDGGTSDLDVLGSVAGAVELTMAIPDSTGKIAQEGVFYSTDLYRDNTKSPEYLAAMAGYAGYYTVALPIVAPELGKPQGNGYLTLTVDDKGKCKTAGKLADETAVSSSLVPALVGNLSAPETCELVVPVFQAKKPAAFGGFVCIRQDAEGVAVVDSLQVLRWVSDNAANTYEGEEGWNYELSPAGGWYDKVENLQTHYLNYALQVETAGIDEFPSELLPDGYLFETEVLPSGVPIEFSGNTISVPKKSLVKDGKIYDFENSVNPCNVQVKFTRATGIVSGSFSLWSEDFVGSSQKEISGFKHYGILVPIRDGESLLSPDVLVAGFCTQKVKVEKRTWTCSLPFNILGIDQGDIDWWAEDRGWNPAWGEQPTE